ncbi:hypothetical protein P170DRAFT_467136 [Aspergillus steynii IBT 23096]|uniref:Uncharacterized protein n=1 Tax=Aspergillus steynii IBT 23096 TaxID=1392250 RepID=A0A2I2FZ89_9EURO|nr:uncharacterized protein P170DRAFT_467136 [Aspergillus steynii IBT 23096]PLB45954.1 hypothetical protein P170DRAFT_467136 [Aspergillus steynii IBT 23096]
MASLSILIPLYPSLCILLSSSLMLYLYRRSIRHALARFSRTYANTTIFRKNTTQIRGHYTQLDLDNREEDLESGFEPENELKTTSDDNNQNQDPRTNPKPKTRIQSPLSAYFNADTSLIHPHLLSPTAPPTPGWERQLRHRIDEGRGLGAWQDRLAERTVRWLFTFSPESSPSTSTSTSTSL